MGMQCHFTSSDLPESTTVERIHDEESDTWTAIIHFDGYVHIEVNYTPRPLLVEHFWFDIGSWSTHQRFLVGVLVQNRVCFSCS